MTTCHEFGNHLALCTGRHPPAPAWPACQRSRAQRPKQLKDRALGLPNIGFEVQDLNPRL